MPAYPRPDSDPAEAAAEAASWAKAFGGSAPPLTDAERATLRDLMVRAKETGQDELLDRLAAFEHDPAGFRAFLKEGGGA